MSSLPPMQELAVLCAATEAAKATQGAAPAVRLTVLAPSIMDAFLELGRDGARALVQLVRRGKDYSPAVHGETDEEIASWILARVAAKQAEKEAK